MENEIKVNEYVRTKRGIIDKVMKVSDSYILLKSKILITEYGESCTFTKKTDIVKHSLNLIDLIEVGDMVHTKDVLNEDWYWMFDKEMVKATKETIEEGIDLVEIITKEMMENISYKVTKM